MATAEVVSMVLVAERPEPQPQVSKGASTSGSGSQDPEPMGEQSGPSSQRHPRSWRLFWVPMTKKLLGLSSQRQCRILEAKRPRDPIPWR
jgi:hypothetical protein